MKPRHRGYSVRRAKAALVWLLRDTPRMSARLLARTRLSFTVGVTLTKTYFRKIESIATILISLGSPFTSEDVVTFALERLPEKYENVCGIITHWDPFPDLKTARSMLTTEEMRLKSKSQALPVDSSSSSPMVLMAESGNTRRSSTTTQVKSWRPCYNFAKGSCQFGDTFKDFMTRRVLLRCDSAGDDPVTAPSLIPHAFLVNQHMWHKRLRQPGSEVLRRLVSNNFISCNKEKPLVLCHVCQLGKHVRLPFVSSNTVVTSCFDIIHSDVWTSPIPSLSGFKY
ncbi:ribonuclease H-like domain-containing protein [Tanacetum coccineum]